MAAVLATVNDDSIPERTQTIRDGLPNEEAGFYSDHLPVGALFVPATRRATKPNASIPNKAPRNNSQSSGLSTQAQQRRILFRTSAMRRRRHNAVLGAIVEALDVSAPVLRDTALYKWPWDLSGVRQKKRAPDFCGVVADTTVVVLEVTVVASAKLDQAYHDKVDKYRDVMQALQTSVPQQSEERLNVTNQALVIALDEEGKLATSSRKDLEYLLVGLQGDDSTMVDDLDQYLKDIVQDYEIS